MVAKKHFEVGETAVTIVADERFFRVAEESIFRSREIIERFIDRDSFFKLTLEPYAPPADADPLIKKMCEAAGKVGVGPMATVAGVIAEEAVLRMVEAGAKHAIVDNGGDVAMYLGEEAIVGVYAGEKVRGLAFLCKPRARVYGICTSSGSIGPSISFGIADAATVVSSDVSLADACATRLGNLVKSNDHGTIRSALEDVCSIDGVEGALVVAGDEIALRGNVPDLMRADFEEGAITRIELAR